MKKPIVIIATLSAVCACLVLCKVVGIRRYYQAPDGQVYDEKAFRRLNDSLLGELPLRNIVDDDIESKRLYMRYMDFWGKSHSPEWSYSDSDSMNYYMDKMQAVKAEKMIGLDSAARWRLHIYYLDKQSEWVEEWFCMSGYKAAPLLVY